MFFKIADFGLKQKEFFQYKTNEKLLKNVPIAREVVRYTDTLSGP
jgi:hypothetical protein